MKKLMLLLVIAATFSSCIKKEKDDPQPKSLTENVIGQYTLTSFRFDDGENTPIDLPKLPASANGTTVSGTITLAESTQKDHVNLKLTLKISGQEESEDLGEFEVRQAGKVYGLYLDGDRLADADGNNIIFNYREKNPQTNKDAVIAFTAKK